MSSLWLQKVTWWLTAPAHCSLAFSVSNKQLLIRYDHMVHHRTQRQHDVCLYSTVCLLNISGQQMIDDEPSGNFYRLVESHLHVESRIIQTGINNDCMYDVSIMYNKVQIKGGHRCLSVTLHFFYPSKKKNAWKRKTFVLFVQKWENVSVLSILTIWLFLVLADHPRVRRGQKSRWRWREKKQREGGRGSGREGQRWRVHGNDPAAAGSPRHGEDGGVRTQGKDHSNTQVCTLY